jgi:hypothetical protein
MYMSFFTGSTHGGTAVLCVDGGSLYRSIGHNINGLNINEPQINCSIHQQKLVDV